MKMAMFFRIISVLLISLAVNVYGKEPAQAGLFLSFEQRVAFSYAVLSVGKSEAEKILILQRAAIFFSKHLNQTAVELKISNFQDFLKEFRGSWPNTPIGLTLISILLKKEEFLLLKSM